MCSYASVNGRWDTRSTKSRLSTWFAAELVFLFTQFVFSKHIHRFTSLVNDIRIGDMLINPKHTCFLLSIHHEILACAKLTRLDKHSAQS